MGCGYANKRRERNGLKPSAGTYFGLDRDRSTVKSVFTKLKTSSRSDVILLLLPICCTGCRGGPLLRRHDEARDRDATHGHGPAH